MVLHSTCSPSVSHSLLFILVHCTSDELLSKYQHCGQQPDGVSGLECYDKYYERGRECAWKPGNHTSEKTYTLLIKQVSFCQKIAKIKDFSIRIKIVKNANMSLEVVENGEWGNCTKAVFSASPKSLFRCNPPSKVSFSRRSGELGVNVSWPREDSNAVQYFSVRYRAVGSLMWIEPSVQSQDRHRCRVDNLNTSLSYIVQIQCVTNAKCSQCPQSQTYTVPPELTAQPVIVKHEDTDIAGKIGSRLLSLTWTFPAAKPHDGYSVNIVKASGEDPHERISVAEPEITLVLSYSAYHLNISGVNNASTSPAVGLTVPQRDGPPGTEGKLEVTVHNDSSFTAYWKDDLIQTYACFSAEWRKKGQKAVTAVSFYQDEDNYKTLLPEPLEPYKRYSFALHTRPQKDTCNIKHINDSESTYASTLFYFTEGSPVSGPNTSSCNVTLNSVVLQWLPIPEEDIRGFLLGYYIHYNENLHRGTSLERNVTVDPQSDTYELGDLKAGTSYRVQVSGFTRAGAGVRSTECIFKTKRRGSFHHKLSVLIIIFAVVAAVLIMILWSPLIERVKAVLWPSIPNPGNSYTIQKMEKPGEMELLTSMITTLKIEEWDTSSLQIVEREDEVPPVIVPLVLSFHHDSEDDEDSAERTCDWIQSASGGGGDPPDIVSNLPTSTVAFSSDYTTMEMFQQSHSHHSARRQE